MSAPEESERGVAWEIRLTNSQQPSWARREGIFLARVYFARGHCAESVSSGCWITCCSASRALLRLWASYAAARAVPQFALSNKYRAAVDRFLDDSTPQGSPVRTEKNYTGTTSDIIDTQISKKDCSPVGNPLTINQSNDLPSAYKKGWLKDHNPVFIYLLSLSYTVVSRGDLTCNIRMSERNYCSSIKLALYQ